MAFLVYFAVLIFAAATAMFGLDLLVSPLPQKPNVHNVYIGTTTSSAPAPKPKTEEEKRADRALSPVYPASPGLSKADVAPAATATDNVETSGIPAAPEQPKTDQAATAAPGTDRARVETAAEAQADHPPSCNVQACASAYYSFRAADCTYQPFEGLRRVCASPPATTASAAPAALKPQGQKAERAAPPRDEGNAEPRQVERILETTDADDDDDNVPNFFGFGQQRRVIVIERSAARTQARACNVAACSRAYSSFNASDCTYQPLAGTRQQCDK